MSAATAPEETGHQFRIKRVYAPADKADGLRVLVDRLWPRGIAKKKARIDLWLKDIAPSDALRRRVHGDPTKWNEFVVDYRHELAREPARISADDIVRAAGTLDEVDGFPAPIASLIGRVVIPALGEAEHAFSAALARVNLEHLASSAEGLPASSAGG